jgi:hypothetical protein
MIRFAFALILTAALGASTADTALLRLLPPDAAIVIGVDVEEGKNSPFGRYLLSQAQADSRGLAEFVELTGFDPRRDLREVYVASSHPGAAPGEGRANGFFAARGVFNAAKILDAARQKGGQAQVINGVNVVSFGPEGRNSMALLDASTAIGGGADAVQAAIARRAAGSRNSAAYLADAERLASRYDAWIYSLAPTTHLRGVPSNQNGELLRSIEKFSGGATFGADVRLESTAVAQSDKDATALQDVIRFVAGMIRLNQDNPAPPEVVTLLDRLQVSTSGKTVNVSLSIPETDLEDILNSRRSRARQIARAR